jgi:mxaA protein
MRPAIVAKRCTAAMVAAVVGMAMAAGDVTLEARTVEPRAFGYQVGDLVQRQVTLRVPDGLRLDEATLPRPGARGRALELRTVQRRVSHEAGVRHEDLTLEYQVFLAPTAVRTLEMPAFSLHFDGQPRAQDLRVDAWPVTVAPLVPVDVSPRHGLGELQPDREPTHIDTSVRQHRLVAYAFGLAVLLAYLAVVYGGLPWWSRQHRPFTQAWQQIRRLPAAPADAPWRAACRQVHEALNETAGTVLFERDVHAFAAHHAGFAELQGDILRFMRLSRREFFAGGGRDPDDVAWLVEFCRRCRDAERGT